MISIGYMYFDILCSQIFPLFFPQRHRKLYPVFLDLFLCTDKIFVYTHIQKVKKYEAICIYQSYHLIRNTFIFIFSSHLGVHIAVSGIS